MDVIWGVWAGLGMYFAVGWLAISQRWGNAGSIFLAFMLSVLTGVTVTNLL